MPSDEPTSQVIVLPISDEAADRARRHDIYRGDGGNGNGGGMDDRLARMDGRMDRIDDRLRGVEINVATLIERVGHLPSKGFIVTVAVAGITLVTGVIGLAVAYQDFLSGLVGTK